MAAMETLRPAALRAGDTIGIVSTSSPVSAAQLDRLTGYLSGQGYRVKVADGVGDRLGHFAGNARERAAGVMSMFADPEVSMVLPATGGTGAFQLVDRLDYDLIRANPKLFAGFSDPTILNSAILARAGLATLYGATGFQFFQDRIEPGTERRFWRMATGPVTSDQLAGQDWRVPRRGSAIGSVGGTVAGPVLAGTLWSMSVLAGTSWMPPTKGAVLVVEQRSATYELIDVLLAKLRLAGVLDGIAALIIGSPTDWDPGDAPYRDVDELVLQAAGGDFPVLTNVPCGHRPGRIVFPVGCRVAVNLDGGVPVVRYEENLVAG